MYIIYILTIYFLLGLFNHFLYELNLFQQAGYKVNKYLKTIKRYYVKDKSSYLRFIIVTLNIKYLLKPNLIIGIISMFLMLGIILFNKKTILKLKLTKRMIRLIIMIILIQLLLLINPLLILSFEIVFVPFIIILVNIILSPLEKVIKNRYIKLAKRKLSYVNPLKIGITGSFGKTTTKHFMYHLLNESFQVAVSPKSYNTEMGICKSIRENLSYTDEIYIAELGATIPKDIEKLTKLVNVDIGVITDIGLQHLETFKTIDNILKTKLEILQSQNIKVLIINNDNDYLRNYEYPNNIEIIKVGTTKESDIYAQNINLNFTNSEFDIMLDKSLHVKVPIVGRHNIINILLAVAVCHYLKLDIYTLIDKIESLKPTSHRLEFKKHGIHTIIDNSFNSNYSGFLNDIDLLSHARNFKIIITPGLVELNDLRQTIHKNLASYLKDKVDFVYLINNTNTLYMQEEFKRILFHNYIIVDTFIEAYNLAISTKEESTILIENDLTDYYLNGGI